MKMLPQMTIWSAKGNRITQSELITHALQNVNPGGVADSNSAPQRTYAVRTGPFVNEYPRRDTEGHLSSGTYKDPNHLLGCFPLLFPYGCGGLETFRS